MMMMVAMSCHWRIFKASVSNVERKDTVRQHAKIPQTLVEEAEPAEPAGATETHDLTELVTEKESVVMLRNFWEKDGNKGNVLRA
jgi:hypothetical protein